MKTIVVCRVDEFMWNGGERRSDRYGSFIVNNPDSFKPLEGKQVKVLITVLEVRPSEHIGDLFHGFFHTEPKVGEHHTLAVGTLMIIDDSIAIKPSDGRDTFWIDPMLLYRLHQQTVEIEVQESDEPDSEYPFWMFEGSEQSPPEWWEKLVEENKSKTNAE